MLRFQTEPLVSIFDAEFSVQLRPFQDFPTDLSEVKEFENKIFYLGKTRRTD